MLKTLGVRQQNIVPEFLRPANNASAFGLSIQHLLGQISVRHLADASIPPKHALVHLIQLSTEVCLLHYICAIIVVQLSAGSRRASNRRSMQRFGAVSSQRTAVQQPVRVHTGSTAGPVPRWFTGHLGDQQLQQLVADLTPPEGHLLRIPCQQFMQLVRPMTAA